MFTGIVEALGTVTAIENQGNNCVLTIQSAISNELKVDQSVAHQGVCLTVSELADGGHRVVAVMETLQRSNLGLLAVGDKVNLERSLRADGLLDGHIVQGHVDGTGICQLVEEAAGSWYFTISYPAGSGHLLVDKGSVCVNGVSLTVIEPSAETFRVAIVPYTFEHTTFRHLKKGDVVNLEFDILGKYLARYLQQAKYTT